MHKYKRGNHGVVINTNKKGLLEARRRKRALQKKDQRIDLLEEKIKKLEELILSRM